MTWQTTLREKVALKGVGLHSGKQVSILLVPAPINHGVTLVRTDHPGAPDIRVSIQNLISTTLATTLGVPWNGTKICISTVEHLLAAFAGLGLDNVRVLIDGPEIPILDGSAQPFVEACLSAGLEPQPASPRRLVIRREVRVCDGEKEARFSPGPGLKLTCSVDFDHPLIGPSPLTVDMGKCAFARDLAPARTFGFLRDVEALKAQGLGLGGSLANAIVIDDFEVLNPEGLRFADEFVRHKTLDALGDLSLLGMRCQGRVTLVRSGHKLNAALVAAVLSDRRNYEVVAPVDALRPQGHDSGVGLEMFREAKGLA